LLLSFYFEPDLSAGSFRSSALVRALQPLMPEGSLIDVVTTQPNRYASFAAHASQREQRPGVVIHRIALPSHKSGMIDQSRAFLAYARQAMRHVREREYDLVFATSSRLMTAVLGAWVAQRKDTLLYLDIRDIFVDTIKHLLPRYLLFLMRPFFSLLERAAVNRAARVNLVSPGFSAYFSARYPGREFSYITNGIDEEFAAAAAQIDPGRHSAEKEKLVVYAGNIGEGQGLHTIIPPLAKKMEGRVRFKVIGDGGRIGAFRKALAEAGVANVELMPPVDRARLIALYQSADVLFLHLNDYDAFNKVLPSKLFEYAAIGKPIWAGLAGFAASFVREQIPNAVVFSPCNAVEAEQVFAHLELWDQPRAKFVKDYARPHLAAKMAAEIIEVVKHGG